MAFMVDGENPNGLSPKPKTKPLVNITKTTLETPTLSALGTTSSKLGSKAAPPSKSFQTTPTRTFSLPVPRSPYAGKKNGQHNETRIWVRNQCFPVRCKIRAMLRIVRRFVGLVGPRYDLPLSIYRDPSTGAITNFDSNVIRTHLREAASAVYHIDPNTSEGQTTLARWSSHSFRIGACIILYASGFTDTQIKHILRWKSDSFRRYLRNLAIIISRQNDAMDDLATMPNIIY
jgi:hypothetical protein